MPSSTEQLTRAGAGLGPERQQKDNLCGPFHAARLLRDIGLGVDQDLVALHAGTLLPDSEDSPQVPPGAVNSRDYRLDLPRAIPARSGTSAAGLAAAIAELSSGRLMCVPISGRWNAAVVERLVWDGRSLGARLIANIQTGLLWGSRPPLAALLGVLEASAPPDPPVPEWDVGHFVELVEAVRGRAGSLVIVQDSYPSLGWDGTHLQPAAVVAEALTRRDGRSGGILAVVSPEAAPAVEEAVRELGLVNDIWDNSTGGEI